MFKGFIKKTVMRRMHVIACAWLLMMTIDANGMCGFCHSYEDFIEGKWELLDTVYIESHNTSQQLRDRSNDFTLTTCNDELDRILKKESFLIMVDKTLYINCNRLRSENARFINGFAKTKRIGKHSLIFVNATRNKKTKNDIAAARFFGGLIAKSVVEKSYTKKRVCYIVSNGDDENGHTRARMIDDALMEKMISGHKDLYEEYYSEEKESKRNLATRVLPILKKAGLFATEKKDDSE